MFSIFDLGARIKAERTRLGLTQTAFAAICGVTQMTQINYEQGKRKPDAEYLAKLASSGIDAGFILTGTPSAASLNPDEIRLLTLFRSSSLELKAAAIAMLDSGSTASTGAAKQIFHGKVGQRIEGDSHGAIINMGSGTVNTKKKKDTK